MKNDIRRQIIKVRSESSSNAFKEQNDQIIKKILNDQKFVDAKCVGLFYPLKISLVQRPNDWAQKEQTATETVSEWLPRRH